MNMLSFRVANFAIALSIALTIAAVIGLPVNLDGIACVAGYYVGWCGMDLVFGKK